MSESNSGAARSVTTEKSNSRRSQANDTHGGKRKKELQRKKKKGNHSTYTAKIHRATLKLKGYYIATHEEVPEKADIMHKNFKEALERHTLKTYSYLQDLLDFI